MLHHTLKIILNHPLCRDHRWQALNRYIRWQIASRMTNDEIVHDWIAGTRLFVSRGETGPVESVYTGLLEFEDMAFFLHFVRPNDLFVDVGSNVGIYTLLCCGVGGASGFAFEPIPPTYRRLVRNLRLNGLEDKVRALNLGIGEKAGTLHFTQDENVTNHVAEDGSVPNTLAVKIQTLDRLLKGRHPAAIKIDVEGFELPVLKGGTKVLRQPSLKAVLIETNGSGERYGRNDSQIEAFLRGLGFQVYSYDPFGRTLQKVETIQRDGNTLFIRDPTYVQKRVSNAPQHTFFGQPI